MGRFLVTQGEYVSMMGSNPSHFQGDPTLPVEQVNWYDATNYCALLTQQERIAGALPPNYVYRLPTEAEWEYACRAGTTTAYYLGNALLSGQANFDGTHEFDAVTGQIDNPSGVFLETTTPGGRYAPNAWGLYDMIGNVMEWCLDWYSGDYPSGPVTDPQGTMRPGGSPDLWLKILRGGSWNGWAQSCRSAKRWGRTPVLDPTDVGFGGFRVVLAPALP